MSPSKTADLCEELASRIDGLIGIFLDGSFAMGEMSRHFMEQHSALLDELEQSGKPIDRGRLNPMMTYNGMAEDSSGPLHNTTVVEFIDRNTVDGSNWELLAQVCLVMAYQYWEDDIRGRIAEVAGVRRNDINLPAMGELRHYRRAIVHNSGRAVPEMERNEILPVFRRGEKVVIGSQRFLDMMFALRRHVRDFATSHLSDA